MKPTINTILTLILILHVSFSFSQTWPKYYGEPGKYDFSEDIIETYDKGYLMCGNIHDYSNGTSMNSWLIKTDVNGEILWEKIFESDLNLNKINAIEQTNDGGFIICGSIRLVINQSQPIIIKLNSCGEKVWCKIFYTPENNPWAQDIKETPSGDIIVLVNQFDEGPEETMHLFKLNAEGEVIWKKPFCSGFVHPEGAIPLGIKVIITSDNKYLISGDVYWENPWSPGGVKIIRPLFVMVDSLGNEDWVLPFGLNDTIVGTAKTVIEPLNNGQFITTGSYWVGSNLIKPLFMKFDNFGNELAYHIEEPHNFGTNIIEGAFTRIVYNDTKYFFEGIVEIDPGEIYPLFESSIDTCIFNLPLQIYDSVFYLSHSEPHDLIKTNDNKLLSNSTYKQTGNWDIALSKLNLDLEYDTLDPSNYTYDSLCTTSGLPQSGFIYLDDCDIITGVDIPSPEQYYASIKKIPIKAYPNPAKDRVNFALENTGYHKNITLKCFNLLGKQVFETSIITGQKETSTVVSAWPQGMYVAVVYSEGLPVGQCKFVVN